ncbi:MAG: hypothetical protein AAF802_03595 [Planctomycetota bacterium]
MAANSIGRLELFAWTDCEITDEHLTQFCELSGHPIQISDLQRRGKRECWWPLSLDPTTYAAPIASVAEHIGLATWFLRDNAERIRSMQSQHFVFWSRVNEVVIADMVEIDVAAMKILCDLDISLQLHA